MPGSLTRLVTFTRIPKIQLAIFLTVIALSAILFGNQPHSLSMIAIALATTYLSDYIFLKVRRIKPFFESAALVSGLIIGLLLFPGLPWYYPVVVGVLAMAGKNFIKWNHRHIFNPASFGLFFGGLLLHFPVSWWGVIFQSVSLRPQDIFLFLILISPLYISFFRLRRSRMILSFFITYILTQVILRSLFGGQAPLEVIVTTLTSPLILFFGLVMLPEPMTSPNNSRLQIFFGLTVALLSTCIGLLPVNLPDNLLCGLLAGNLIYYPLRLKFP